MLKVIAPDIMDIPKFKNFTKNYNVFPISYRMKMAFRFKPTQNKQTCILWSMLKEAISKGWQGARFEYKGMPYS